jgi:hypothetical protein
MADPDKPDLRVENSLPLDPRVIIAALREKYIVSLVFWFPDRVPMEYFFNIQISPVKVGQLTVMVPKVRCIMYTATSNDPLRLRSSVWDEKDIVKIINDGVFQNGTAYEYRLGDARIYTSDWDPGLQSPEEISEKKSAAISAIPILIKLADGVSLGECLAILEAAGGQLPKPPEPKMSKVVARRPPVVVKSNYTKGMEKK